MDVRSTSASEQYDQCFDCRKKFDNFSLLLWCNGFSLIWYIIKTKKGKKIPRTHQIILGSEHGILLEHSRMIVPILNGRPRHAKRGLKVYSNFEHSNEIPNLFLESHLSAVSNITTADSWCFKRQVLMHLSQSLGNVRFRNCIQRRDFLSWFLWMLVLAEENHLYKCQWSWDFICLRSRYK